MKLFQDVLMAFFKPDTYMCSLYVYNCLETQREYCRGEKKTWKVKEVGSRDSFCGRDAGTERPVL